ncbi:hypothetical protein NDI37_25245 [Funiculus sociatus GB2-A5]|uniref:Secreted protein n=1 Tax=Funiculus sociatus GB2-A5 TaxID=2933946 RepID=A0ABV0JX21_9CYAN|nr:MULTISPECIES: hypothetical protein [unclassified Trichocoleus]MBD1905527.1 hypothetical protein [Trichocoleus sp. FACHB-832]MBD2065058.1 hypothetical protein [Trichocoleus sp. FACHB-6]
MAVVLSLVSACIASLREVLRVLALEGLLWVEALPVSVQARMAIFSFCPASSDGSYFTQSLKKNIFNYVSFTSNLSVWH